VFGDLLHGQFFGVPECRLGNPMAIANPLDHRGIEGLPRGTAAALWTRGLTTSTHWQYMPPACSA
jgi:hypothetical protein